MAGSKRILAWVSLVVAGVVVVGLGVAFGVVRLDAADKWGSVIGALASVIGLAMTVYGLVQARRSQPAGGQSVTDSTIGDGLVQVTSVSGNLRIKSAVPGGAGTSSGPRPGRGIGPKPRGSASPTGQSVTGSQVSGSVYQVRDIGGDADLDR